MHLSFHNHSNAARKACIQLNSIGCAHILNSLLCIFSVCYLPSRSKQVQSLHGRFACNDVTFARQTIALLWIIAAKIYTLNACSFVMQKSRFLCLETHNVFERISKLFSDHSHPNSLSNENNWYFLWLDWYKTNMLHWLTFKCNALRIKINGCVSPKLKERVTLILWYDLHFALTDGFQMRSFWIKWSTENVTSKRER